MEINKYFVDAFTGPCAGGNRACVIELEDWLPAVQMQDLARETGLPETAFFKSAHPGRNFFPDTELNPDFSFELRWFTPDIEMDLCGHATLATGYTISTILRYIPLGTPIVFNTNSGRVEVAVAEDGRLTLDFPSRMPVPAQLPECIYGALNPKPSQVYKARDYVAVYDSIDSIRNITIDSKLFNEINIDPGGVVLTASAAGSELKDCDFVSRFFTPQATIPEDPVTGSAHCSLVPFWASRLGKEELVGRQLSSSGGILYCRNSAERVFISGYAKEVK
ncbi:MAG: PhzF family phenazine biosynthesis protein [Bacteroidales bacterium]|nr:PhzF family phenazine biosynthesis protein [Bacteroidales bacterium]